MMQEMMGYLDAVASAGPYANNLNCMTWLHLIRNKTRYNNNNFNTSMFGYLRTLKTWHYPHSLLRRRPCSNRPISPIRRAHSSKPAGRCCSGRMRQTYGRTPYRYIDPGAHSTIVTSSESERRRTTRARESLSVFSTSSG